MQERLMEVIKALCEFCEACTIRNGQEDYNKLRPLSYRRADVFLLTFSLISRASYENVTKKWIPELRHYAESVPIVLVGTKLDLREDPQFSMDHLGASTISTTQGEELKKKIGASAYLECSSKTQQVIPCSGRNRPLEALDQLLINQVHLVAHSSKHNQHLEAALLIPPHLVHQVDLLLALPVPQLLARQVRLHLVRHQPQPLVLQVPQHLVLQVPQHLGPHQLHCFAIQVQHSGFHLLQHLVPQQHQPSVLRVHLCLDLQSLRLLVQLAPRHLDLLVLLLLVYQVILPSVLVIHLLLLFSRQHLLFVA